MLRRTLFALTILSASAGAQVPAAPVLQNAFVNSGLAVAANFAGGAGQSFYGLAAALGMGGAAGNGRFQLSGAAGAAHGNGATRGAYGARAAMSVWSSSSGSLGAGAFAGIGGAPRTRTNGIVTNPAVLNVPAGVTVAYRRPIGTTRGISGYVSPLYRWTRFDSGVITSSGSMRVALGVDFSMSPSLGVTLGGELGGGNAAAGASTFAAAVSFVPGGR